MAAIRFGSSRNRWYGVPAAAWRPPSWPSRREATATAALALGIRTAMAGEDPVRDSDGGKEEQEQQLEQRWEGEAQGEGGSWRSCRTR